MISAALADELLRETTAWDWCSKLEIMKAAAQADGDAAFRRVAEPLLTKVGPKGYIHGWIFVGAPGVGDKVHHPVHGDGTVTAHDGKHATVKFDKSGATHTFEARKDNGKGKLVERAQHNSQLADRVARDPKSIKGMSHEELTGVDQELTRRAGALGKKGKVSPTHQKVKDEIARRGTGGKVTGVSQEPGKNYEELRRKAINYNATSPPKEGSALRTYSDPEKQKEAIRLHTEARRAAPDAKSKKLHTDAINQHKAYLAQIEHNQNVARFNKDKADTEAKIKDLNKRNHGSDPKVYDDIAAAHDHLADIHEQHQKDLTAAGYGGQYGHEVAADKARGRADAARESAANIRARQDEAHAKIKAQMPGAEAKVAEWEKTARQSKKAEDLQRAARGHDEIARHAGAIGDQKRVDAHTAAAAELRGIKPGKTPSAKRPVEGVPEDEKIKTPWGTMHPADQLLQHPGAGLNETKHLQDAIKELDRRGATPDGKDKISRTRTRAAADLKAHEAWQKEYNKPGGLAEFYRKGDEAKQASDAADKAGTAEAHQAAADAHREALTLTYRHQPHSTTEQYHRAAVRSHQMQADALRQKEEAAKPKPPAPKPKAPRKAPAPKKTAEPKEQTPDDLSKKAKRTGTRDDHRAAGNAHAAVANDQSRPAAERQTARYKAEDHKRAVESIDMADEYKDDAEIHADAAEQTKDPEAHDAAAKNYRDAAEHMDDVPGGKKQAAALRASAKDHEEQAKTLRQKIADYVKAFTHANKLTNAARKSGTASAHQAAAAAHRVAAQVSLNGAQVRHHRAEVARHVAAARNVE